MFLCVEILDSFEVEQRISGFLVVFSVFSGHGLEVFGAPLGEDDGRADIDDDTQRSHDEEDNGVKKEDNGEHEDQLDDEGQDLEEGHSQDGAEGLGAAGHSSNHFAGFSGEVKSQGLVLHVSVDHVRNIDFCRGAHVCEGDFSDVVHEVC